MVINSDGGLPAVVGRDGEVEAVVSSDVGVAVVIISIQCTEPAAEKLTFRKEKNDS